MTAARLSIKDISVRFGGLMALESVGLELGDNQLLGFIGPNGAGKTTLMRVITGIVRPVSGQVMLDGRNISTLSSVERIHAGVALGQQIVKPLREMSLLDNVALAFGREKLLSPLRALSVRSRDAEREAAKTILSDVGLGAAMHKLPNEVPLGYLKRLEVARALALRPRLLLLDEPLSALDLKLRQKMRSELRAIQKRVGITFIYITHDQGEALTMSDRIAVMNEGRIEQVDSCQAVYEQPKTPFVASFVGENNPFYGEVTAHNDRQVEVVCDGNKFMADISGNDHKESKKLTVGQKIILFVRPESISIKNSKAKIQNSFSARLDSIEFEGHLQNLFLTTESGMKVRLSVPNSEGTNHLTAGQTMELTFSAQKAVVLPEGNLAVD